MILTLGAVTAAAAVDSVNPCAFAILIILMASVIAISHRKQALKCGLTFIATVYVMYFLIGMGLLSAMHSMKLSFVFYYILAALAILLGLLNIKDYFAYGKGILLEVPRTWRPRMKLLLKSVKSVWGAFVIAVLVSFFLLPCTSGPYIVILSLLTKTETIMRGILWLIYYNIIFILPMFVILFAVYFGLPPEKVERWRQTRLRKLHLIAGIILLLLGVFLIFALRLGWI